MISSPPLQGVDTNLRLELESGWQLLVDPSARLRLADVMATSGSDWREARVGLSWNAQFPDLRNYMGAAWYRTRFDLPTSRDAQHVLLKFGAVDYFCEVFVNHRTIGTHEGGYTPFSFEITNLVQPELNEILIHVIDPPMDEVENRALFPEMMYNEIPHGKQNWYVQNSGIWQGVRIELCPSIYIERLDVTPSGDGEFVIEARLAGSGLISDDAALDGHTELQIVVRDGYGRLVFDSTQRVEAKPVVRIKGKIANVDLWSPDCPALYELDAYLSGAVQHHRRTRFGFRDFQAKEGKLYLNSRPFYMRAALDQDFYPETVHTPTSKEYVRDMMLKAKQLGFNVLRCHLKVAHPVYLDVADEVGMLIWSELPSWSDSWFPSDHFSAIAAARTDKMFWEILIRDWNHPCIIGQTIMNESWGINLTDATQRDWLKSAFNRIKGLLSPLGRFVVDNSPCEGNFHIKSDLDDFHQYFSMPDQVERWDKWVEEFAQRPAWSFSPHGDAVRTRQEPLVVSEFGNWGLPKLPAELPWWFDVNFGERETTRPSGVLDRFGAYKLDQLFGAFNQLADETQWHQFASLKHEIESIRRHGSIQGYVITGITDVHWEANGVMDMWRQKKAYAHRISEVQNPDLLVCKFESSNFYSGALVSVKTFISHYSDKNLRGAVVRWSCAGEAGDFAVPISISCGEVAELASFQFQLEKSSIPKLQGFKIELRDAGGQLVSQNSYDLFVFPRPTLKHSTIRCGLLTDSALKDRLKTAGYQIAVDPNEISAILIVGGYDDSVAAQLKYGGKVLMIIDSETPLPFEWDITAKSRVGSDLDGRWVSNHNWIRSDRAPFSDLAFTQILGFEAAKVVPDYVLQGVPAAAYEDVLAGITFGWLNKNSALALQMKVGPGRLMATTFRFDAYGADPYATHLLDTFLRYVQSPDFLPIFEPSGNK
jgi:hypothetical protein